MKSMTRLTVAIPSKPYDVWIENGLLEQAGTLVRDVLGERQKLFVITVSPVKKKWGKKLAASLTHSGYKPQFLEMPDGERHKALSTVEALAEQLVKQGADRKSAILALAIVLASSHDAGPPHAKCNNSSMSLRVNPSCWARLTKRTTRTEAAV